MTHDGQANSRRERAREDFSALAESERDLNAARRLRVYGLITIGTALLVIYASANLLSAYHTLLGLPESQQTGQIDFSFLPDDGLALVTRVNNAGILWFFSSLLYTIPSLTFFFSVISLYLRRKRGSVLAGSVTRNRAMRYAVRIYIVVFIAGAVATPVTYNAFRPKPYSSTADTYHLVINGIAYMIAAEIYAIGLVLAIVLAIGRELSKVSAASTASRRTGRLSAGRPGGFP